MLFNTVIPNVNTGYSATNPTYVTDDENLGFQKYNAHEHIRARAADFRTTGIQIGDSVYIYDAQGKSIFSGTTAPTIDYITGSAIRVTASSLVNLTGATLYYRYPRGNSLAGIVLGIDTAIGSQTITFTLPIQSQDYQQQEGRGLPGFISQAQMAQLATYQEDFALTIMPGIATLIPLIQHLSCPAWLTDWYWNTTTNFAGGTRIVIADPTSDTVGESGWTNYTPISATFNNNIIPLSESIAGSYPSSRPTKPLAVGTRIGVSFSSAPTFPGVLAITLCFQKVL